MRGCIASGRKRQNPPTMLLHRTSLRYRYGWPLSSVVLRRFEMILIAYPFLILSAVGLALSVISHVCAMQGVGGPLGDQTWFLHIGIFIVWLPGILAARHLSRNVPQKYLWKATLRGCPIWMQYAVYGLFGYAIINFLIFMLSDRPQGSGPMPPAIVRGFSGHWMIFYGLAFAILWSYIQLRGANMARRCPAGHEVGPLAKFCEQCGQPIQE